MALPCTMHSTYAAFFKREGLLYVSNLTHACSHFSSVIPTINTTKEVPYNFSKYCKEKYRCRWRWVENTLHMVAILFQMFNWMLFLLTNPRSSQIASSTASSGSQHAFLATSSCENKFLEAKCLNIHIL